MHLSFGKPPYSKCFFQFDSDFPKHKPLTKKEQDFKEKIKESTQSLNFPQVVSQKEYISNIEELEITYEIDFIGYASKHIKLFTSLQNGIHLKNFSLSNLTFQFTPEWNSSAIISHEPVNLQRKPLQIVALTQSIFIICPDIQNAKNMHELFCACLKASLLSEKSPDVLQTASFNADHHIHKISNSPYKISHVILRKTCELIEKCDLHNEIDFVFIIQVLNLFYFKKFTYI